MSNNAQQLTNSNVQHPTILNALLPMKQLLNKNVSPPTKSNVALLMTKYVQKDTLEVIRKGMEDIEAKEAPVDIDEVGLNVNITVY